MNFFCHAEPTSDPEIEARWRKRPADAVLKQHHVLIVGCGPAGLTLAVLVIRPLVGIVPDGVNPWSLVHFAGIFALLLAAGAAAVIGPARRAARVDAAIALRD